MEFYRNRAKFFSEFAEYISFFLSVKPLFS